MKNKNKLIFIIFILISIIIVLLISSKLINSTSKENNKNTKEDKTLINEYYIKMHSTMAKYYKIKYKNLNIKADEENPITITLKALSIDGFPIEEFVSYDGKEKCDLKFSFAIIKYENNKQMTYVYYKCGEDSNYDYKTLKKQLEERE